MDDLYVQVEKHGMLQEFLDTLTCVFSDVTECPAAPADYDPLL